MKIERAIVYYDKKSEKYQGEKKLRISLAFLKNIFHPRRDDPQMYGPYPIKAANALKLRHFLKSYEFDFKKYDYFIECFDISSETKKNSKKRNEHLVTAR
jgi:hypothetical protein